jgi:Na+-driven multidrug efflux pump
VTLRDATRFFLPLIFMTELNMISKSVIHAFLARLPEPKIVLAAFSISFAFYYTLTSCTEVNTLLAISYLRTRRAARHLLGFFCLIVGPPVALTQLVAWTPLGVWLYGDVFGAGPEAIRQAQWVTFWLALSAPILMVRALAFALIMLHRRTIWITWATLLRLISLGGSLLVLPALLGGAAVGAAALVLCMAVEAAFAAWAARPYYRALPAGDPDDRAGPADAPLPSYAELWRFAWPLWMSQAMEIGIVMTINIFLGRLAQAELALASFGVVHGLANVVLSPMRNLVQTAQTLARTRADVRVLLRFTTLLVLGFTVVIAVLFGTPLRGVVLAGAMGLSGELLAYSEPALLVTLVMAGFWGYAALFRGLLAGARRTATVAVSALSRMGVVLLIGSATLLFAGLNGAVIGIVAWAATFVVESAVLGWRLASRRPGAAPLFPEAAPAETGETAR